ncbi:hypothetical protein CcaverHIS002_0110470 [Cutaneotrichosporon cavernicola]|nr:hypothetical protein CcaverHIS002_0110470 [Cutaneotrichosporon cavernicola]BEJ03865.1 hypothetical protein CcaverHIS641_0110400 [Cutaneotrichosporon cavernicola]
MSVRKSPPPSGPGMAVAKRARVEDDDEENTMTLTVASSGEGQRKNALVRTIKRTSGLEAPIVSLAGAHGGEITACKFDPRGETIAACSIDRGISLWKTYPPHDNYGLIPHVHKQAVLDIAFSLDSRVLYSGGADGYLIATDLEDGSRVAKYAAHFGPLNSIAVAISGGHELVLTGGDDGIARVWDLSLGTKDPVAEFDDERDCPVTAVEWSHDGNQDTRTLLTGAPSGFEQTLIRCAWSKHDGGQRIAAGGGDRTVTVWDVQTGKILYKLPGHKGAVTGVDLHPREPIILTGSKDSNMLLGELDAQDFS